MPSWTPTNVQNLDDEIAFSKEEANQLYHDGNFEKSGSILSHEVGLNLNFNINLNIKELPGETSKEDNKEGKMNNGTCHKQETFDKINSCSIQSEKLGFVNNKNSLGMCQSNEPFVFIKKEDKFNDSTCDMMQSCSVQSGREGYLDSKNTLGTCQSKEPFVFINDLPVFLNKSFFKLQPKEGKKKKKFIKSTCQKQQTVDMNQTCSIQFERDGFVNSNNSLKSCKSKKPFVFINKKDEVKNSTGRKQETIDMIQYCSVQTGIDGNLDGKNTLGTYQSKNPFVIINDPPVFLNESFSKEEEKEELFNNSTCRKQETIDNIQFSSVQSGRDGYLDSKNTLGTCQSKEPFVFINDLPVFLNESFFKLQPKKRTSSIDYFTPSLCSSPTPSTSTITSTSTLSSTLTGD